MLHRKQQSWVVVVANQPVFGISTELCFSLFFFSYFPHFCHKTLIRSDINFPFPLEYLLHASSPFCEIYAWYWQRCLSLQGAYWKEKPATLVKPRAFLFVPINVSCLTKRWAFFLLESDLNMSKSHAIVVGFDENVSYLSTWMNLHKRREHFFMNETAIELTLEFLAFKYN